MARSLSAAATAALSGAPQATSRADVYSGGVVVLSTDNPDPTKRIYITQSRISYDGTRDIFSDSDLTLLVSSANAGIIPTTPTSPFNPVTNVEIQLYSGLVIPATGVAEYVPIARHIISATEISEQEGGVQLQITGSDRSSRLQRAKFPAPYTVAKASNFVTAAEALIRAVISDVYFLDTPTVYTTPLLTFDIETSYLDAVKQMFAAIGFQVRFDSVGNCMIIPVPDGSGDPVWTVNPASGVDLVTKMVGGRRNLSSDNSYNGVVIRGETTGSDAPPVTGQAWDTDPSSPTYYDPANPSLSQYGPVPYFETSEYIITTAQANDAAAAMLPSKLGAVEKLELAINYNPAIEVDDLVRVERPRIGASGVYMVESVDMALGSGVIGVTFKERRLL